MLIVFLVVDDEPDYLELITEFIKCSYKDATVLTFGDPEKALKELFQRDPDLLLLDTNMPILSGCDILKILTRKMAAYPILVMGSSCGSHYLNLSETYPTLNAKILEKPFDEEAFRKVLKTALKMPRDAATDTHVVAHTEDAETIFNRGENFYYGDGVQQDYTEAAKCFRKAADLNYAAAQYNLGECYYQGIGVPQDYEQAVHWYRKAAEQGIPIAQCNLGWCYKEGKGVARDFAEAMKWLHKAAENDHNQAQHNLGWCYYEGIGVPQDYAEAVKWYRKAADQGFASAQCNLGLCYEKGQGVPLNIVEAYKLYKLAVEQNVGIAVDNLERIVTRMTAVEIAEGERRFLELQK